MLGWLGVLSIYIATFNAFASISIGTCTQGDASQLWGGALSAVFYSAGLGGLVAGRATLRTLTVLVPALLLSAWESWFAMNLAFGYFLYHRSACSTIVGNGYAMMDGDEAILSVLWLSMYLMLWLGAALALRKSFKFSSKEAE